MTTISANGATEAIYLRMNGAGTAIERSIGTLTTPSTWVAISSWPVTITNTNPIATAILNVVVTENLTISSSTGGVSGYFIVGSSYVTFDGAGFTTTITNVPSYIGLIRNGTFANGQANVAVKNFTTARSGTSTLATSGAWLCQTRFGRGVTGITIDNCTNTGAISGEFGFGGGIMGAQAAFNGGSITITNCSNSGAISGNNAGGIAGNTSAGGSNSSMTFTGCSNTGAISGGSAGGIVGSQSGTTGGSVIFTGCSNSGTMTGNNAGGIAGASVGLATFTNCSNTGTMSIANVGGIAGSQAGSSGNSATFTDCTNSGNIGINAESAGGIAGSLAGNAGSATFTGCTNTGLISGTTAGGIAGGSAGNTSGSVTITNCSNSGAISGNNAGGIAGNRSGYSNGSATFTGCSNTGTISGVAAGGIAGLEAGFTNGSATFTGCSNTGAMSGSGAGGIAGSSAGNAGSATFTGCSNTGAISGTTAGGIAGNRSGFSNGSATFTGCSNTGAISGSEGGGIAGPDAGSTNGSATFTECSGTGAISGFKGGGIVGSGAGNAGSITINKCFSTGDITGQYAGGIAGYGFARNTNQPCGITNSYSTGAISGDRTGGIAGANVGYSNDGSKTAQVSITACYSLGAIATTCGGICGGWDSSAYTTKPTITISNTYSYGALTGTGTGLVAVSLTSTQINLTTTNTYVAAGSWTDASANANLTSTPTGTGITIGQATTWTSLSVNVPYLLSTFFSLVGSEIFPQIYTPNSISTADNGNSVPGLYQPGVYSFANTSQVDNTFTAKVYAIGGTTPIYYGYGYTTYSINNTNGGSGRPITATINGTTGVISFILPYPCFLEGTKILCFENNQEVYRPVESLRKGDLVKTIYNGYLPIHMIGTSPMYNPNNDDRIASRLYKCSKENYPSLIEDLYITGCHSILVPWLTYVQGQMTIATLGNIFVTDKHCRLMAWVDENAEPYTKGGMYNIYHIALENDDYYMNYGIYANGLLVESCSKRYLTEMSNMRVVGEEDSRVKESETPTETLFPKMTNLIESC